MKVGTRVEQAGRGGEQGSLGGRPGVPQSNQVHVLMSGGRQGMERLFPGFIEDCISRGAVPFDYCRATEIVGRVFLAQS